MVPHHFWTWGSEGSLVLLQIGEVVMSDKESPKIGAVTQPGVMETVLGGGRLRGFEQWELLILHCNVPHYHDSALLCICAPLCLCFQWANFFHISSWSPERGNLIGSVHLLTPCCDIGHPNGSGLRIPDCLIKNKRSKWFSSASSSMGLGMWQLGR